VQVKLIYDGFGAWSVKRPFFERLKQAGMNVLEFKPMGLFRGRLAWSPNHRDHRKLRVVDGRTAFLGGINISSVYSTGSVRRKSDYREGSSGWRDTGIQIEGPIVADFQRQFMSSWAKQLGAPLGDKKYFPTLESRGQDIVRALGSAPDYPFSLIYVTPISAISNAERTVMITNACFVPDPQLVDALLSAARRGVEVTLILPSQSDSATVFHAGRAHYASLLAGEWFGCTDAGCVWARYGSVYADPLSRLDGAALGPEDAGVGRPGVGQTALSSRRCARCGFLNT